MAQGLLGTVLGAGLLACTLPAQASDPPEGAVVPLTTTQVATGLNNCVFVTHAPGDYKRLYLVEKRGVIKVLNLWTGTVNVAYFLGIQPDVGTSNSLSSEQGLLGLAFHPDFQNNGYFYVNYTDNSGNTVIERYTATDPDDADESTAEVIMTINQPFGNHNGGWMGFGPLDGYLYIATGDGGSQNDPFNNSQDTSTLLGSILRIDVDTDDFPADPDRNYGIPTGNPTATIADEIFVYGFRNPWRCGFDSETGDLYVGDVGDADWEEIDFVDVSEDAGGNYGWRCYEGDHDHNTTGCDPIGSMTFPIHEYSHLLGYSTTGGLVYRGCAIPSLRGTYFFADYGSARIWSFLFAGGTVTEFTERTAELDPAGGPSITRIASFGADARGEMYIVEQNNLFSEVYRIVPVTPTESLADFNCDGAVNVMDLLEMLAAWGSCDGCQYDLNHDGTVGIADLLQVLTEWG